MAKPAQDAAEIAKWDEDKILLALSPQDIIFCNSYLQTADRSGSYMEAYPEYEGQNARVLAFQKLKQPLCQRYLEILRERIMEEAGVSPVRVAAEAAAIAFFDIDDVMQDEKTFKPWANIPKRAKRAITEVKVTTNVTKTKEGTEYKTTTTTMKFDGKAAYLKMLNDMGGYNAAQRKEIEVSGPLTELPPLVQYKRVDDKPEE